MLFHREIPIAAFIVPREVPLHWRMLSWPTESPVSVECTHMPLMWSERLHPPLIARDFEGIVTHQTKRTLPTRRRDNTAGVEACTSTSKAQNSSGPKETAHKQLEEE